MFLKDFWLKHSEKVCLSYININSVRNKLETLLEIVCAWLDFLAMSKTKVDSSFPTTHFDLPSFRTLFRKGIISLTSRKHLSLVFERKIFNYKQWYCFIKETETYYFKKTSTINIQDIFETSFRLLSRHLWQASHWKVHRYRRIIQYNTALAITGAIKGTSKEKLYNELGFEYLKDKWWVRRLCLFHKIYKLKSPKYLYNPIS